MCEETRDDTGHVDTWHGHLGSGQQLVMGHHLGHQAYLLRLLGLGLPSLIEHSPGVLLAHDPLEVDGGAALGQHAQLLEGGGEGGPVTGQGHIAQRRPSHPAPWATY